MRRLVLAISAFALMALVTVFACSGPDKATGSNPPQTYQPAKELTLGGDEPAVESDDDEHGGRPKPFKKLRQRFQKRDK